MKTKQPTRAAANAVHFYLDDADWRRLGERAAREPRVAYAAVSEHQMARLLILRCLDGERNIPHGLLADVENLRVGKETPAEALERVLRVGVGRVRTLEAQKSKA